MDPIVVNARIVVPAEAIEWHAVRSGGPGGQNVNKVASKVELRIQPDLIRGLDEGQRARLHRRIATSVNSEGEWVITSQRSRSQVQNLEDARQKALAEIVAIVPAPRPRRKTRPSRAARERRLSEKRQASERKKQRSWRHD